MNLKPLITGLCAFLALAVIAAALFALPPTATAQDPSPTPTPSSPTPTPPPPPAETETPTPPPTDPTQPTPTPSPLSGPQQYCRDAPYIYSLEAFAPTDTADADTVVLWWYDDGYPLPPGAAFTYRVARASASAAANPDDAAWVTLTEAPNINKWTDRPGPGSWRYRVGIINLTVDGAVAQNCATLWAEATVAVPTEQERREREAQRQLLIAESVRCAVAAFAGNFSAEARPVISRIIEQRVKNNFSDLSTLEDVASVSIMLCAGDAARSGFYGYSWVLLWLFPESSLF